MTIEEMQTAFVSEQEQLRLAHLGLDRLSQIIEKGLSCSNHPMSFKLLESCKKNWLYDYLKLPGALIVSFP